MWCAAILGGRTRKPHDCCSYSVKWLVLSSGTRISGDVDCLLYAVNYCYCFVFFSAKKMHAVNSQVPRKGRIISVTAPHRSLTLSPPSGSKTTAKTRRVT